MINKFTINGDRKHNTFHKSV